MDVFAVLKSFAGRSFAFLSRWKVAKSKEKYQHRFNDIIQFVDQLLSEVFQRNLLHYCSMTNLLCSIINLFMQNQAYGKRP
jgi:hypothetical protein